MRFRSVAAFLWLPQFRLSTEQLRPLWPLCLFTIAHAFAAHGLISKAHPAIIQQGYGASLSGLIMEAWQTLRTDEARNYQGLSVFMAVVTTLLAILGALVTVIAFLMAVTPAAAQLFSHPLGDSSIDQYERVGSSSYDTAVPAAGTAQGDYAIMLLDKVVRAGAAGKGVPLQNALSEVMQVYNTAMLVVASFIIFWIILSIVVDTAKTGQVGGGRHNTVWAPIRIVFALSLIIPLGSVGYSSGQFMVMKLAEWGSNLGTNAWNAYVDGITESQNLVAHYVPDTATAYVKDMTRLMICSAAYNGQLAMMDVPERMVSLDRLSNTMVGTTVREWRTDLGASCGTLMFEHASPVDHYQTGADSVSYAISGFKQSLRNAYVSSMLGALPDLQAFACDFVASHAPYAGGNETALAALKSTPDCGSVEGESTAGWNAIPPARLASITAAIGSQVAAAYSQGINTLGGSSTGDALSTAMKERGWAGMGSWYHRIAQLNAAAAAMTESPVSVIGGDVVFKQGTVTIDAPRQAVSNYDDWWVRSALYTPAATINPQTGKLDPTEMEAPATESGTSGGLLAGLMQSNPRQAINLLVDATGITQTWVASLASWSGGNGEDVYPLAKVSAIGESIAMLGVSIQGIMLYVHGVMAAASSKLVGTGADLNPLANSYAFELIPKIGMALIMAGMMLKFYIPLIPFIRSVFAVLTWIISVFEAVVMVPIAALAHLSTEGEGLSGPARSSWILWFNILVRPVLVVIGFIGAMLVFNAFIAFFSDTFINGLAVGLPTKGLMGLFSCVALAVVYVFIMYTAANTIFKMLDLIPNAVMRWIGGSADTSFDDQSEKGALYGALSLATQAKGKGRTPKPGSAKNETDEQSASAASIKPTE